MISRKWITSLVQSYDYRQFQQEFCGLECRYRARPSTGILFNRCKSAIKFMEYSRWGWQECMPRCRPTPCGTRRRERLGDAQEWNALGALIEDSGFVFMDG